MIQIHIHIVTDVFQCIYFCLVLFLKAPFVGSAPFTVYDAGLGRWWLFMFLLFFFSVPPYFTSAKKTDVLLLLLLLKLSTFSVMCV